MLLPTSTQDQRQGFAALLSLIVPGVGQIYTGRWIWAIFFFIFTPGFWLGTPFMPWFEMGWIPVRGIPKASRAKERTAMKAPECRGQIRWCFVSTRHTVRSRPLSEWGFASTLAEGGSESEAIQSMQGKEERLSSHYPMPVAGNHCAPVAPFRHLRACCD